MRALAGAAALAIALALVFLPDNRPTADGAVRGIALGLFAHDPDYDYGPLLDEIAARGATDVLLAVPWYQAGLDATAIAPRPGHSPADGTVRRTLDQARARGLRVALLPFVRLEARRPGHWRGVIRPADVGRWFESYGAFVGRMATIAAEGGAARLYVGSELGSMMGHEARWRALIADVRRGFSGALSYAANWDHLDGVPFWDALDEIGTTAYFPLPANGDLAAAWTTPRQQIAALAARHGKPVVLVEVGYPSRPSAAERPWDDGGAAPVDLELQARLYAGFCAAWAEAGVARGFYAWNWFGIGGPRDSGFSLRGKPAAARVGACLRAWITAPSTLDPAGGPG